MKTESVMAELSEAAIAKLGSSIKMDTNTYTGSQEAFPRRKRVSTATRRLGSRHGLLRA